MEIDEHNKLIDEDHTSSNDVGCTNLLSNFYNFIFNNSSELEYQEVEPEDISIELKEVFELADDVSDEVVSLVEPEDNVKKIKITLVLRSSRDR